MSADGREQLKKYKQQICERLCSILEPFDPQKSVEAYSYVLRYYLSQYQEKSSDFLQKMLKQYLDSAVGACLSHIYFTYQICFNCRLTI